MPQPAAGAALLSPSPTAPAAPPERLRAQLLSPTRLPDALVALAAPIPSAAHEPRVVEPRTPPPASTPSRPPTTPSARPPPTPADRDSSRRAATPPARKSRTAVQAATASAGAESAAETPGRTASAAADPGRTEVYLALSRFRSDAMLSQRQLRWTREKCAAALARSFRRAHVRQRFEVLRRWQVLREERRKLRELCVDRALRQQQRAAAAAASDPATVARLRSELAAANCRAAALRSEVERLTREREKQSRRPAAVVAPAGSGRLSPPLIASYRHVPRALPSDDPDAAPPAKLDARAEVTGAKQVHADEEPQDVSVSPARGRKTPARAEAAASRPPPPAAAEERPTQRRAPKGRRPRSPSTRTRPAAPAPPPSQDRAASPPGSPAAAPAPAAPRSPASTTGPRKQKAARATTARTATAAAVEPEPEPEPAAADKPQRSLSPFQAARDIVRQNVAAQDDFLRRQQALHAGCRVRRNPESWKYGDQDGGEGNLGTVTDTDFQFGRVKVKWDDTVKRKGVKNSYRWGRDGWDLVQVQAEPAAAAAAPAAAPKPEKGQPRLKPGENPQAVWKRPRPKSGRVHHSSHTQSAADQSAKAAALDQRKAMMKQYGRVRVTAPAPQQQPPPRARQPADALAPPSPKRQDTMLEELCATVPMDMFASVSSPSPRKSRADDDGSPAAAAAQPEWVDDDGDVIRFRIDGDGLRYGVNGEWRPPTRCLLYDSDGGLSMPDIAREVFIPEGARERVLSALRELASVASVGHNLAVE
eukprot:TRINITY_DN3758_c6_g1_i1.p1 TRINITY_DN3758_c6_g1~~TRINITY_DN3758_c6_g1_i1.p1  ORF type:complete len:779 (+),score=246.48 TRINITY_DN3758_c6_g1_i1:51-2339(+)